MNDKPKTTLQAQRWQAWGGALVAAIIGIVCFFFANCLSEWSYDLSFLFSHATIDDVAVVYLNENCYTRLKQNPTTLSRTYHARLLQRLRSEGAKMVVFDLLFTDTLGDPTGDLDFAKELAKWKTQNRPVVLAGMIEFDPQGNERPKPPLEIFETNSVGWGSVEIHRPSDFAPRRHHPGTQIYASLAWAAAAAQRAEVTDSSERRGRERWLNYYGPSPFRGVPFSAVVLNEPLPPEFSFSNKVVFVGAGRVARFLGERNDEYRFPWTRKSDVFLPGVDVHAITFSNLVRSDWFRRLPRWLELVCVVLLGSVVGYRLPLSSAQVAAATALLTMAVVAVVSVFLLPAFTVWFPWLLVEVQVLLTLITSVLFVLSKAPEPLKEQRKLLTKKHSTLPGSFNDRPAPVSANLALAHSESCPKDSFPETKANEGEATPRKLVFISYSHQDKNQLEQLTRMLAPVVAKHQIAVWSDTQIRPGQKWTEEIEEALCSAKVAVLLVSASFLASDFITKLELPALLGKAQTDGLKILWVCLSACPFEFAEIGNYQAVHNVKRPLDKLSKAERNEVWTKLCRDIKEAMGSD